MLSDADIDALAKFAGRLADAAGHASMAYFRSSGLAADNKASGGAFDPVTVADRAAETAMREILARERPDDGIHGEEQGLTDGRSGLTWVLDPIDGTRAYLSGLPTWGTLIALDDGNRGRIGLVDQPFTGERFTGVIHALGSAATFSHKGQTSPITTRSGKRLDQAILFTTAPEGFTRNERPAFEAVRAKARLTRYGIDCYAYALLAMGQIDLVVESGLQAYDIAAPAALIMAAGGIVTNWRGGDCRHGGRVLAAASPELHDEVRAILAEVPEP